MDFVQNHTFVKKDHDVDHHFEDQPVKPRSKAAAPESKNNYNDPYDQTELVEMEDIDDLKDNYSQYDSTRIKSMRQQE